jgi:type VI secretion system protein ImpM
MTPELPTRVARAVGFIGKIPARGDFVRQNIGERIGVELEQWLLTSVQNLYQAKCDFPDGYLRFVFSAAACDAVAIGVMVKSRDQVDRSFPLAIFTSLSSSEASTRLAALPLAYSDFFTAAESVLAQASNLTLEALRDRVLELVPPLAADAELATARVPALLAQADGRALLVELFGGCPEGCEYYGLFTFCAATSAVQSGPASSVATVLDCPINAALGPAPWLDLAARRLAWQSLCPTFMFTSTPGPRLLLAMGFASDQLLQFVADPSHPSARLWPLTTQRTDAIARARTELQAPLAALAAAAPLSLDELWVHASRIAT